MKPENLREYYKFGMPLLIMLALLAVIGVVGVVVLRHFF